MLKELLLLKKRKSQKIAKKYDPEIEEVVLENVDGMPLESDKGAVPPIEEVVENDTIPEEDQLETVKVKIIKEYFVVVRSILTYEDESYEDKTWEIQVKNKFTEYQRQGIEPNIEPYEIVLEGDKKKEDVSINLSPKRTISSINVLGKKYLMRGH